MKTLACFRCDRVLEPVFKESELNQPRDGVVFDTHGQYGSRIFDELDGAKLQINICDECLVRNRKQVAFREGCPKREWLQWSPDWLPDDLAVLAAPGDTQCQNRNSKR